MQKISIAVVIILFSQLSFAQTEEAEVVKKVDELRIAWDSAAEQLQTYAGLSDFCANSRYRNKISMMLDEIHHYDTLLYGIVSSKFKTNEDPEAKATLDDILTVEEKYTTRAFKLFLRQECSTYNDIERNLGAKQGDAYQKEVSVLEKELANYVMEVTKRIDIIDEHVHHLHLGK